MVVPDEQHPASTRLTNLESQYIGQIGVGSVLSPSGCQPSKSESLIYLGPTEYANASQELQRACHAAWTSFWQRKHGPRSRCGTSLWSGSSSIQAGFSTGARGMQVAPTYGSPPCCVGPFGKVSRSGSGQAGPCADSNRSRYNRSFGARDETSKPRIN